MARIVLSAGGNVLGIWLLSGIGRTEALRNKADVVSVGTAARARRYTLRASAQRRSSVT